jgi:hypothetical protein
MAVLARGKEGSPWPLRERERGRGRRVSAAMGRRANAGARCGEVGDARERERVARRERRHSVWPPLGTEGEGVEDGS